MMKEAQLYLFGFSPDIAVAPKKRDHKAEYARKKELKRIKEEIATRTIILNFDCPFDTARQWAGLRNDTDPRDYASLENISEEDVIYLHHAFMFKTLHFLGDSRVNKMLKQRIFETWLFQPIKPHWVPVEPFSFQACCTLYWDTIDPYEVQCLFIDSKSRKPNFNLSEFWDDEDIPNEIRSVLSQPIMSYSYPWEAPESAKAHLDHLKLHERATKKRHELPKELFIEVVEWINQSGWTDDYRLMPFSFDACCKYAGVDADEHRKLLINQIRKFS